MENYLKYLEDLLFFNGVQKVISEFIGNEELLLDGFDYLKEYDYYMKDEMIIDGVNAVFEMTIIKREDFFIRHLNKNKQKAFEILVLNSSKNNFPEILIQVYNNLDSYIKKSNRTYYIYKEILSQHLVDIVEDFKIKFPIIENHKVFKVLNDTSGYISYFQYKELKASFFEELYEASYMLSLIDDVEVSEEDFYDIFTAIKPNSDLKITFIETNHLVAFFLKEIEPFFNNLNSVTIEKSKFFFNKQGKPLTSSDLYTAISRNKDKNLDSLKKIKSVIDDLKKKYLK